MEHFSNGAILKSNISQMEHFSNEAILKSNISQMKHFSNRAFLKWSNSQIEHFSNGAILKWSILGSPPYAIFQDPKNREIWHAMCYQDTERTVHQFGKFWSYALSCHKKLFSTDNHFFSSDGLILPMLHLTKYQPFNIILKLWCWQKLNEIQNNWYPR